MKELESKYDVPYFLGQIIFWCFRWGCEVKLRNTVERTPEYTNFKNRFFKEGGSIIDMQAEFGIEEREVPELVFSHGERSISVSAVDFPSLMETLQHRYKYIFMQLAVFYFDPFKESTK